VNQSIFPHLSVPNIPELLFRSCCVTGRSVAQHLSRLRTVTDAQPENSLPPPMPWRRVLDNLDSAVFGQNEAWTTGGSTLDLTMARTRQAVESVAILLRATPGQAELAEVLVDIASGITDKTCDQLHQELEEINQRSYGLVGDCVRSLGGSAAKSRWESCKAAKISFAHRPDIKSFVARTIHDGSEIEIQVGDRPFTLHSYLTLEFQFYHEYLSHIFAVWDSEDGMFSEGDLAALEKWTFPKLLGFGFPVLLLNKRERESIVESRGKIGDWGLWQEEMEHEVRGHWAQEGALTRLLLDLAALPVDQMPVTARERLLKLLHYLPKVGHKWLKNKQLEVRNLLASDLPIMELSEQLRECCYPQSHLGAR
jgi:hypothetical protein